MPRRLTRNRRDAVLGGVAAGFGDYFTIDPVLVRLAFVLLALANGIGLLLYVICWAIIPAADAIVADGGPAPATAGDTDPLTPDTTVADEVRAASARVGAAARQVTSEIRQAGDAGRGRMVFGLILIAGGSILLLDRFSWMFRWPYWLRIETLWPLILVAIGVALVLRSRAEQV